MYNLQGIIRKTAINATTQYEKLGWTSQNVSNYLTPGYKKIRFEQMLSQDGYLSGSITTDHSMGDFYITKQPYDLAIRGAGYVPLTTKEGEIVYTRYCSFNTDKDGYLVNASGDLVGDGIKIPINMKKIEIKSDGRIIAYKDYGPDGFEVDKIPIVQFANPSGLESIDGSKFRQTEESGEAQLLTKHDYIAQYGLERSNVNVYDEINGVLRLNASLLASTKLMQAVDKMYENSINLRG